MEQKKPINLLNKFKNSFLKSGKSYLAFKLIVQLLNYFSIKYNISPIKFLLVLYKNLNCFLEIRQVKIKRRIYFIPFSISKNRRSYLIFKKLREAICKDKRKISLFEKLKFEILLIIRKDKNSKTLEFNKQNNLKIIVNRSNIHFRW
jgi:ribosomal protein S7